MAKVERVMFYSGSVSHDMSKSEEFAFFKWYYPHYVSCVCRRLKRAMSVGEWNFLLNRQPPPVFSHGIKEFTLYKPSGLCGKGYDGVIDFLGEGPTVGHFSCSASVNSIGSGGKSNVNKLLKVNDLYYDESLKVFLESYSSEAVKKKNCSSRVNKGEVNNFVNRLENRIKKPVFSVSDCNSFHTSGYLWGMYALKHAFGKGMSTRDGVAIINFDQHPDVGSFKETIIGSDSWGLPVISELPNSCYLSIGNMGSNEDKFVNNSNQMGWHNEIHCKKNGKYLKLNGLEKMKFRANDYNPSGYSKADILKCNITKLSKLITVWDRRPKTSRLYGTTDDRSEHHLWVGEKEVGDIVSLPVLFAEFWRSLCDYLERPIKYVFVSVDRDCLQNHYTQWQDFSRFIDMDDLLSVVDDVLKSLYYCSGPKMIGFDITGLPEHSALTGRISGDVTKIWRAADEQIKKLYLWSEPFFNKSTPWGNVGGSWTPHDTDLTKNMYL